MHSGETTKNRPTVQSNRTKRRRPSLLLAAAPSQVGRLLACCCCCSSLLLLSSVPVAPVRAAQAYPYAFQEEQPDGRYTPALRIKGGPDHHYLTDEDDYVVISEERDDDDDTTSSGGGGVRAGAGGLRSQFSPSSSGAAAVGSTPNRLKWKVYADRDSATGKLKSSHLKVGRASPRKAGLLQRLRPGGDRAVRDECHMFCDDPMMDADVRLNIVKTRGGGRGGSTDKNRGSGGGGTANLHRLRRLGGNSVRTTGKLTNLVLLLRFADHPPPDDLPSPADVEELMNAEGGHPTLAPTGSLKDYYLESSYGKLEVHSVVTRWITVSKTEAYYADGASGSTSKFEEAIIEALTELDDKSHPQSFSFTSEMDGDGDGIVDSTMVLTSGYGAEWGKTDCRQASIEDRIWSHAWEIGGGGWFGSEGFGVKAYHTTSALWSTCGNEIARIGTMAHELGHILGCADMYADTNGIGSMSVMANSWGHDGSQRYPPMMDPWSKIYLGWLEPTELTESGTYEISASVDEPVVYMIKQGYNDDEYLLIENRQDKGFDRALSQGGLAIYHVDDAAPFTKRPGYPGQAGWPENGNHYRVACIQADGTFDLEQNKNRGDKDDLWHSSGPTKVLGPPLTHSYQGGIIKATNHKIENIGFSNDIMTFDLLLGGNPVPTAPTAVPNAVIATAATTTTTKTASTVLAEEPKERHVSTSFAGDNGSFGNMFDMATLSKPIVVTSLCIHTRIKTEAGDPGVDVEVYTKEGGHAGYETGKQDEWNLVSSASIEGNGFMIPSCIPEKDMTSVTIRPHSTQAFYITLLTADLRYDNGSVQFGQPIASTDDLHVMEGSGIGGYPFGPPYKPRTVNAVIKYQLVEDWVPPTTVTEPTITSVEQAEVDGSDPVHQLETTFVSNNGAHGSMFNVRADVDVTIVGMDINTKATGMHPVEVYSKEDTYEDSGHAWTKVFSASVQAQGPDNPTHIAGDKFASVSVAAGKTRAFYVTMATSDIRYTNGKVQASDGSISIEGGAGVGDCEQFDKSCRYDERAFNGVIYYTT